MKKISQKIIHISLIICLITINFSVYTPNVEAEEATTLREMKEQYEAIKKDYEENIKNQQLTQEERERIKNRIYEIETTISNTQDEIYNIKLEIEKLNQDIELKEKEIATLLSFYQVSNGESAYLEYAFGAQDFTDFIYRVAVSEQLTSYNNSLIEQYKQTIEESKKKSEELTIKIGELEKQEEELSAELVKLADQLEELYSEALSIEDSLKVIEGRIQMYEQIGCTLDEDLEQCVKDRLITDDGFYRPVEEGHVSSLPGVRYLNGVKGWHHGLDISNYGANYTDYEIYPIANGKVIYMDINYNCGGRRIYIEHNVNGKLYISGYWHLRSTNVSVGQTVTRDTVLGIMGGTESWDQCTEGAHLHLEMSDATIDLSKLKDANGNIKNFVDTTRTGWLDPRDYINLPSRTGTYQHWTSRYKVY